MKIILFNGPPRSGKDTAATILYEYYSRTYPVKWEKFSFPNKRAFAAIAAAPIDRLGNVYYYEEHKAEPISWLDGASYRDFQIHFSESFMKPLYGEAIFARMLIERIRYHVSVEHYLCLISDCGFQVEVDELFARWPNRDLMLLTILRDGTSFDGDSRNYVAAPSGIRSEVIYNNGTLLDLKENLLKATKDFLESTPTKGA